MEPFQHLQLYVDFLKSLKELKLEAKQIPGLNELEASLTSVQELCRQRHDESYNMIRLLEWDWVLDFDRLQSHSRDDMQVFCSVNRQIGAPLHFSLTSSPRSYIYHGFVDVEIQNVSFTVLAILVTDCLIFAQPIAERDASHHKNWIVHTFLQSLLVTTIRDSEVLLPGGTSQQRLELCLSQIPTSFSFPYQYKRSTAYNSIYIMPPPDALQIWTDCLLGWSATDQKAKPIDLKSPALLSARGSYLPGATSRPASYVAVHSSPHGSQSESNPHLRSSVAAGSANLSRAVSILSANLQAIETNSQPISPITSSDSKILLRRPKGPMPNPLIAENTHRLRTGRVAVATEDCETIVGNATHPLEQSGLVS